MNKMIWSPTLCEMVVSGFTRQAVLFGNNGYKVCRKIHYTWNECDCLYYSDETDEDFYMEVPYEINKNAYCCYSVGYTHKRYMLKIDKGVIE